MSPVTTASGVPAVPRAFNNPTRDPLASVEVCKLRMPLGLVLRVSKTVSMPPISVVVLTKVGREISTSVPLSVTAESCNPPVVLLHRGSTFRVPVPLAVPAGRSLDASARNAGAPAVANNA